MKSKIDLSKIPLSKLLKEVNRRQPQDSFSKIKRLARKNKLKLAAQLTDDGYVYGMPYIMLGILDKKDDFKDFYYNSGLEYEQFQQYIPDKFHEAMESTYEYCPENDLNREEYVKEAFDILTKCGYKRLPDWVES